MCTDTAIHRRQAGQECSWTNTDWNYSCSSFHHSPVWIIHSLLSLMPFPPLSLYLPVMPSLLFVSCHSLLSRPRVGLVPLLLCVTFGNWRVNSPSALILFYRLWGYCSQTQLVTETSKHRMMWLLEPHPGWSFLSGSYERWGLDTHTLHNQKMSTKQNYFVPMDFLKRTRSYLCCRSANGLF